MRHPRYINEKIELELVEFKREIEERFANSEINRVFVYPLKREDNPEESFGPRSGTSMRKTDLI